MCFEAVIFVRAKKKRVGERKRERERERCPHHDTAKKAESCKTRKKNAPHGILKMNKAGTFLNIMSERRERFLKAFKSICRAAAKVCWQ